MFSFKINKIKKNIDWKLFRVNCPKVSTFNLNWQSLKRFWYWNISMKVLLLLIFKLQFTLSTHLSIEVQLNTKHQFSIWIDNPFIKFQQIINLEEIHFINFRNYYFIDRLKISINNYRFKNETWCFVFSCTLFDTLGLLIDKYVNDFNRVIQCWILCLYIN